LSITASIPRQPASPAITAGAVRGDCPAAFTGQPLCLGLLVHRADRLAGRLEGGIARIDRDLRQQAGDVAPRQFVPQRGFDHIADHALGLGAQHVQRIAGPQGQQPDLRAIAVGDDQRMLARNFRQSPCGGADVRDLPCGLRRLVAAQQRVPAKGCDHQHHSPRSFRKASRQPPSVGSPASA
jgi:hypothetical protein